MSSTNLFKRWQNIKARCYNPKAKRYERYGGRGIVVCDEWLHDFAAFANWAVQSGYLRELQIDRIDNDGPYAPNNCRWVTPLENSRNRGGKRAAKTPTA